MQHLKDAPVTRLFIRVGAPVGSRVCARDNLRIELRIELRVELRVGSFGLAAFEPGANFHRRLDARIVRQVRRARQTGEFLGDSGRWQNEIDRSGRRRTVRHRSKFGRSLILREGHATLRLNRLEPERAIRGGAGQDHTNRPKALIGGQRTQKIINRTRIAARQPW